MRKIPLSRGLFAIVSDEDYEALSARRWYAQRASNVFYAVRSWRKDGRYGTLYMHRVVIGAPNGVEVDHINRNPLDNRRENLRLATRSEQCSNMRAPHRKGLSFGLRGIYRRLECNPSAWASQLKWHGRRLHGPSRTSEFQAAFDYDALAFSAHGEFAVLNFPCRANKLVTAPKDRPSQCRHGGPE